MHIGMWKQRCIKYLHIYVCTCKYMQIYIYMMILFHSKVHFGSLWGDFGANLGHFGATLGSFGFTLELLGVSLGDFGAH